MAEIVVSGLDSIDALIRSLDARLADPEVMLQQFLAVYQEAVRDEMPQRTGAARDSVTASVNGTQAMVEATVPYALYIVLGVRAQWMTWLEGKRISFIAKDGTRVVRIARVGIWGGRSHWWRPETPPNDVFKKALETPRVVEMLRALADAGMPVQVAYTYGASQ